MSTNLIVIPTRVNKTAAQWSVDFNVYSENKILVVTDLFYDGTDQPRHKFADGTQTFNNLDFVPEGGNTLYSADDQLAGPRTVDAFGNFLKILDMNGLVLESTAALAGGAFQDFPTDAALLADISHRFGAAGGSSLELYGNRFGRVFGRWGFGDAPQSNFQAHFYTNDGSNSATVNIGSGPAVTKAMQVTADAINGFGMQVNAQSAGAVAFQGNGYTIGVEGKATDISGTGIYGTGGGFFQDYGMTAARNVSAVLEAHSTSHGFLQPRHTTSQMTSVGFPVAGLSVYNTNYNHPFFYNGSNWKLVTTSGHVAFIFTGATTTYQNDDLIGAVLDRMDISGAYIPPVDYSFNNTTGTITYATGFAIDDALMAWFH